MIRLALLLLLVAAPAVHAARDVREMTLLRRVAEEWLGERDRWAFTQFVREYDGKELKQERLERYDPSRGYADRWQLISINGRPPTAEEWGQWNKRKNKKARRDRPTIAQNFDFEAAKVLEETPEIVRYELPLRSSVEWLFPINKVELIVTIDKTGPAPALAQVQARISEPFRVALGLARILDIDLDVQMEPPPPQTPAEAKPSGTAQAVVTKLGDRIEYFWSDFQRVTPRLGQTESDAAENRPRSAE
ncbi:hypothetical protein [Opitutus terrae]|uniref:Uncharacterized protein n=1 Tax=Opitutus terrae (strain DSM 11246 / JCM 15787 / PB90-1) TaxID=452637 RepID=B1ZUG3_OPITP|nr:hypothetical protein [Opitutus terrae]ACB74006.1 hypothetical protein Oter_0717 [Opitutus terrae PB90-1]